MIWGVCSGLADYFEMDPTVVRLIAVLSAFLGGFVILAYLIFAIVIPLEPSKDVTINEMDKQDVIGPEGSGKEDTSEAQYRKGMTSGMILVLVGVLFLAGVVNLFWWFHWGGFWAFALVLIGVLIILANRRR